jgi:hypothetical protein
MNDHNHPVMNGVIVALYIGLIGFAAAAWIGGQTQQTQGQQITALTNKVNQLQAQLAPAPQLTAAQRCPLHTRYQECIITPGAGGTGLVLVASSGGYGGTPLLITDHSAAPMLAVTISGLFSFGQPGYAGGLVCTTRGVHKYAACLTPNSGMVALYNHAGKDPVYLTRGMIIWLEKHDK